uniref:Uncharacterized protein n=1 Tax=Blattodean phasma-related virus OKIAV239 TaxID=2746318 RepID=A0A7D7JQ53_9VIRU|nr:hypothetical protein [Blattodean phasma-related virus OKIAV239]
MNSEIRLRIQSSNLETKLTLNKKPTASVVESNRVCGCGIIFFNPFSCNIDCSEFVTFAYSYRTDKVELDLDISSFENFEADLSIVAFKLGIDILLLRHIITVCIDIYNGSHWPAVNQPERCNQWSETN